MLCPQEMAKAGRRPYNSEQLLRLSRVPVPISWPCIHPPDWLGCALPPPHHEHVFTQLPAGQEREGVCLLPHSLWVYLYPQIQVQSRRYPQSWGKKEGECRGGHPPARPAPVREQNHTSTLAPRLPPEYHHCTNCKCENFPCSQLMEEKVTFSWPVPCMANGRAGFAEITVLALQWPSHFAQ